MTREVNAAGCDLIKSFEKLRLVAYDDGYGYPTVGYGSRTRLPIGTRITEDDAEQLFEADLDRASDCVERSTVGVDLTDNQFAALVSLTFNIGPANFRGSTLLKDLLAGDFKDIPSEERRWDHAGGRISEGLDRRREAEIVLWGALDA